LAHVGEREAVEMRARIERLLEGDLDDAAVADLTGRAESVCGASGTSASAGTAGWRIGPCADRA